MLEHSPAALEINDADEMVLDNYAERPATALLFLSSRCQATEQSIAEINRRYEKYRLREVLYVGVCANDVETADELETFAHQRDVIFSIHRDPSGDVASRLSISATPEVCLLDRSGRLVYHGDLDTAAGREALETAIGKILSGMPAQVDTVSARGTPIDEPGKPIQRTDPYALRISPVSSSFSRYLALWPTIARRSRRLFLGDVLISATRRDRHCLVRTLSSISAMFIQLT